MHQIMNQQKTIGVDVRYLMETDIPAGTAKIDFGIWDKKFSCELSASTFEGAEFQAIFCLNQNETQRLVTNFNTIYSLATIF